jgi:guanylate kinase
MVYYLFVVAGPSGVGKSYLGELLIQNYPDLFEVVKIFTTRGPRPNESNPDRIFITEEAFEERVSRGEFLVHGKLQGNKYGYEEKALVPEHKHLIVNAWPALIPEFAQREDVITVGLGTRNYDMLKKRMSDRGDTPETIRQRMAFIERDMADLESVSALINRLGRVFEITDDSTIAREVIPWVNSFLATLKA